ncbi:cadherin-like domain-containing protein [Candidatus Woesearchaeota archaeon]|nr:cadherin-like domain-containing protein [Candidatus Woesearchaeota archaeon]
MVQRKFKSWMIIGLFILMLPIAAAVNFNVNCPASSLSGQSFTCQVNMPTPLASGLSSLSFTANAGGATIAVTFPQGTTVSSGGTYGFFTPTPVTNSNPLASVQITPITGQTSVTLQLTGVRGRLGDNTLLLPANPAPNNIAFNSPTVTIGSTCTSTGNAETSCNGIDDDCDGSVDENFVGTSTTCGVGVCVATGLTTCPRASGQTTVGNSCTPRTPIAEVCTDSLDNDCDGTVNEGCTVCVPRDPTACTTGVECPSGNSLPALGCSNGQSCQGSPASCQPTAAGNNLPVAEDDTFTVVLGAGAGSLETTFNVLTNDRDPDNDALRITSTTQPANGLVSLPSNRRISYRSNAGFTGTDSFTYTISDGRGGTATATVTVTVSSSLTCTFRAATCSQAGVNCPDGSGGEPVSIDRVVCSGVTPFCNTKTGLCETGCAEGTLLADPPVCTCVAPLQNVDGVCKCPPSAGRAQHLVRGQCTLLLTEIKDSLENDQQYSGIMQKVSRIAEALKNFLRAVHLIN